MDVRGFVALSLFFCLTAATLIGFWLFKWTANRPIHDRLVLAVLPFVLVAVSESSLYQVLITPHLYWSGARLAPTVALTYGHKIYQLVGQGSLLDTFYGPISYLVYLPAALTSSVTISILIASVISVLFFFVPVL